MTHHDWLILLGVPAVITLLTITSIAVCWLLLKREPGKSSVDQFTAVAGPIGAVRMTVSKEEFEQGYAERTCRSVQELREFGGRAKACDCGEDDCPGWQMVFPEHNEGLWQAALAAFNEEKKQRLWIDGEVVIVEGRFVDPDRVKEVR